MNEEKTQEPESDAGKVVAKKETKKRGSKGRHRTHARSTRRRHRREQANVEKEAARKKLRAQIDTLTHNLELL